MSKKVFRTRRSVINLDQQQQQEEEAMQKKEVNNPPAILTEPTETQKMVANWYAKHTAPLRNQECQQIGHRVPGSTSVAGRGEVMTSESTPTIAKQNIQNLEARVTQLGNEEKTLSEERAELLIQVEPNENRLQKIEARLLVIKDELGRSKDRIGALQKLIPTLEQEEEAAHSRVKELVPEAKEKMKQLEELNQKALAQTIEACETFEEANRLAQETIEVTIEVKYLNRRFGLQAPTLIMPLVLVTEIHWNRLRILSQFVPTPPSEYVDRIKQIDYARNRAGKRERNREQERNRVALAAG